VAESKLAKFVEDIIVPPKMIDVIVDGEVFFKFTFYVALVGLEICRNFVGSRHVVYMSNFSFCFWCYKNYWFGAYVV